ncbi:hypothetical protein C7821_111353 [Streptomyces sp. VMFN-G11Ma]|nr:hypothetical protein C7821_111353 [Streptomyces sp. VMFN-G11Ma]
MLPTGFNSMLPAGFNSVPPAGFLNLTGRHIVVRHPPLRTELRKEQPWETRTPNSTPPI